MKRKKMEEDWDLEDGRKKPGRWIKKMILTQEGKKIQTNRRIKSTLETLTWKILPGKIDLKMLEM